MLGVSRTIRKVVGVQGFEPWTPCSQSRCATRLRYTPTESIFYTESAIAGKSCKIRGMVAYFSSKFTKHFQSAFAASLLVFCLLGTHWVGLSHSISHANPQNQSIEKYTAATPDKSFNHSSDVCHLFDSLTLAGCIPSANTALSSLQIHALEKFQLAPQLFSLISLASYQSRAPPSFIL